MYVGILGPLVVEANGRPVEIGGHRLRALLARLAVDADRTVSAGELTRALWPELMPADPVHALQSLVSRLRRILPDAVSINVGVGGYRLAVPPSSVDIVRFEGLTREGQLALERGDPVTASSLLGEALSLWRGPVLADLSGAPFAVGIAARLEELRLGAQEDRLWAELLMSGDPAGLTAELSQLAAANPLRARPRLLLLRALQSSGRRAEALASYEQYRRLLAGELGADPDPELQALHLELLRAETATARRGNLPVPLSSFVGREVERSWLMDRLGKNRLVTVTGPGGVGKTRLATTVAADLAAQGGVWLVELAGLAEPWDVPTAVVRALGLREPLAGAPREEMSRIVEALSAEQTVLVLDNCEHLIDAVASFTDHLLGRCPRLTVLATSREPLTITGEVVYPLTPLPTPDCSGERSPAMDLFADRAAAARPGFLIGPDNRIAVAEICQRLDGLPLAIELAAARLRSVPLEAVIGPLGMLVGGSRTASPRHRTLAAVVGWSWDLLDVEERRFAGRLAVFPAPISPEAAERVCGPRVPAIEALATLADKSLLQLVEGAEPRYRMLETIRSYALGRLSHADLATARGEHAAYFLGLAETAEPHLHGSGQLSWVRTLTVEDANLRAALRHAADAGDAETGVRLAAALAAYWTVRGDHFEATNRIQAALRADGSSSREARGRALAGLALNLILSGGRATADLRPELAEAKDYFDDTAEDIALIGPALALLDDEPSRGIAAVDGRMPHPDPWTSAVLTLLRAMLNGNAGDREAMAADLRTAVAAFRALGERWGVAFALMGTADLAMTQSAYGQAITALEESVCLLGELGSPSQVARVWLAMARARQGDPRRAEEELRAMIGSGPMGGDSVFAQITLGDLLRHNGRIEDAGHAYRQAAEELARTSTYPQVQALLDGSLGHLAVASGDPEEAVGHLRSALQAARSAPDLPIAATVAVGVVRLAHARGSSAEAAELLGAAHAVRGAADGSDPDVKALAAELCDRLGEAAYRSAYARGLARGQTTALEFIEAQVRRR